MNLMRAILKLMAAAIIPACTGGGAGGGDPLPGDEAPYEADIFLDFETGNPGDYYTTAMMGPMLKGMPVRWSTSRALSHTKVRAENKPLLHPVKVGGVTYTGTGTRSLEFDLDEAVAKNLSPLYEHLWGYPPAGTGEVVISGMEYIGATSSAARPSLGVDMVAINSGTFVVQQVGEGNVHIETQVPNGVTFKSSPIPRKTPGKWYYFALRYSRAAQRVEMMLVDPETGELVGSSGKKTGSVAVGGDVTSFAFQSYLIFGGGRNVFDNIAISFSNPTYPPFRIPVLPGPSYVSVTQVAPDQVRLIWPSTRAAGYRIERSRSGGDWTPIAEVFQEDGGRSYVDTTVKDGDLVQYRVSSFVGSQASTPTLSSPFTVTNSPGGPESVWIAQTTGGSSRAVYFDGAANSISQKIKNGQVRHVSEVQLTTEFTDRTSNLWIELWSQPDGTGTLYGISGTTPLANGVNVYTFFAPATVPAADFWLVLRDPSNWARTQVVTTGGADVYEPGGGYDAYQGGAFLAGPSDLKFTIKTRE
jgi:hypothetical protein